MDTEENAAFGELKVVFVKSIDWSIDQIFLEGYQNGSDTFKIYSSDSISSRTILRPIKLNNIKRNYLIKCWIFGVWFDFIKMDFLLFSKCKVIIFLIKGYLKSFFPFFMMMNPFLFWWLYGLILIKRVGRKRNLIIRTYLLLSQYKNNHLHVR